MRMLPLAVLEERELWCDQPPWSYSSLDTHRDATVLTVLQMRHTPRCDGPGESVGAVNG